MLNSLRNKVALLICAGLLSYCTSAIPGVNNSDSPSQMNLLSYYNWVKSAPLGELESEKYFLQRNGDRLDPVFKEIQLALLLSVPASSNANTNEQAMEILSWLKSSNVLVDQYKDARAIVDLLDLTLSKDKAMQEAQLELDTLSSNQFEPEELHRAIEENRLARQEIEQLNQKIKLLEEQIAALTTIEQQLLEREQDQILLQQRDQSPQ